MDSRLYVKGCIKDWKVFLMLVDNDDENDESF
jgi:hypothetical protein